MKVWNGIERYPTDAPPAVVTIGNYDGVHLGHRAILNGVVAGAREIGGPAVLVTFEPHPAAVVAPERRPALLQTRRQKIDSLEAAGLDGVLFLEFTPALARRTGEEFFDAVLDDRVRLAAVHVGESFRFGHGRTGDVGLLREIGRERGFDVVEVPPVRREGRVVSSSAIRRAVAEGDVDTARSMLGRAYAVEGEVVRGDGRGRRLSYPTANLAVANELIPRSGVYVTETVALASRHPSVTNVGIRPTFGGDRLTVESHLIEWDGDLYGEDVEIRFLARLRDEMRFSGPAELSDQIARDLAAAAGFFVDGVLEL